MKIALACIFAVLILFTVPVIAVNADQENTIPSWIKQTMDFWVQGISTDREFLSAIEYMLGEGIITVDEPAVDVLTIGFIPVEKADKISTQATALELYLEDKMPGVDIKITIPTDYETIIEGMRFGHIDAAFMDTGPAWITHQRSGAEVILAEVVKGKINYQATVWTVIDNDDLQH